MPGCGERGRQALASRGLNEAQVAHGAAAIASEGLSLVQGPPGTQDAPARRDPRHAVRRRLPHRALRVHPPRRRPRAADGAQARAEAAGVQAHPAPQPRAGRGRLVSECGRPSARARCRPAACWWGALRSRSPRCRSTRAFTSRCSTRPASGPIRTRWPACCSRSAGCSSATTSSCRRWSRRSTSTPRRRRRCSSTCSSAIPARCST